VTGILVVVFARSVLAIVLLLIAALVILPILVKVALLLVIGHSLSPDGEDQRA
jgi:hypothetical protein